MTFPFSVLIDAGAEVYEVGGMVRDQLLGRTFHEHDYLVRKLPAKDIIRLLQPFGKVTLVGQSFGVIKFSPHDQPHNITDIALPRKELSTGLGHRDFEVSFDPQLSVEEDLGRRDFTINAMAKNVQTQTLVDPFHGQEDLQHRRLRMVFPKAFEEDPLRMLRAIQFAARLQFDIEPETLAAITSSVPLIRTVSAERIIEELRKLMTAPKPSEGFRLMAKTGLLQEVIPELAALIGLGQDKKPGDDVFDHTMRTLDAARIDDQLLDPGNMHLMFAALFHDVGKFKTRKFHEPSNRIVFFGHQIVSARQAKKWMSRMKIETIGIDPQLVCRLVEHHMFETKAHFSERSIRRFVAKIGPDIIFTLMDLRLADNRGGKHPNGIKGVLRLRNRIKEELEKKPPFGPKDLAMNGHDLILAGVPAGPIMGKIIQHLVEVVLDEPELNQKEMLLAKALEYWREHDGTKKTGT